MSAPIDLTRVARDDDEGKAATALESYFLRQLLTEMRGSADGGMLDGGFAGATFREMLDGAMADSMAQAGGIGIAKTFRRELERDPSEAISAERARAAAPLKISR